MGCNSAGAILHLQVSVVQLMEVWYLLHVQPDAETLNVSSQNILLKGKSNGWAAF